MKSLIDRVVGLIKKAESDLRSAKRDIEAEDSLDAACFHSQQATEKYLKAFLIAKDRDYPYSHNLSELIRLCALEEAPFADLAVIASELSDFAVTIRYDDEVWPIVSDAEAAFQKAILIKEHVLLHLPEEVKAVLSQQ